MMAPYTAGGHQPDAVATLWDGNDIVGQVPLVRARRRLRWLPLWLPFNCDFTTSANDARCLFLIVKDRWERLGDDSYVPKWLRARRELANVRAAL